MNTVTVACKLPNGLQAMCINAAGERVTVTFNGSRLPLDEDGNVIPKHVLAGRGNEAFGLTQVDADFWAQWAKENATYIPFAKGMIFSMADEASAVSCAKEMAGVRTGLEPASRDKKDMPRGVEPVS
jgi:hypothetical protein